LTHRQFARGHVEDLEAQVEALQQEKDALKQELDLLRQSNIPKVQGNLGKEGGLAPTTEDLALDIGLLSLEGASDSKYVGESSGVYFGKLIEILLPRINPDDRAEKAPNGNLEMNGQSTPMSNALTTPTPVPDEDMANKLQEAYFCHRWPSLPFLHKPTFIGRHFKPVLQLGDKADRVSLFLTYMVFAVGSIDIRHHQRHLVTQSHLDYFKTATSFYLSGFIANNNLETIQGLLLMAQFAINEPQSLNAWMVSGLAMRLAIDLGLHRKVRPSAYSVFESEMRKRVFWAAYAVDRNICIALGRPLGIQDNEINVELPLPWSDDDLTKGTGPELLLPTIHNLSTFIHIIKVRQLGARIQTALYPTNSLTTDIITVHENRKILRNELEDWIVAAPRYKQPIVSPFQSSEWFLIAFNHMLLLIYRPSPVCPEPTIEELQICSDASISLITLFATIYSKNKSTYTWISLHCLFMASVTMFYTLARSEIREGTTEAVTRSNINTCLTLFQNMVRLQSWLSQVFQIAY
jgi:hypothetical protein